MCWPFVDVWLEDPPKEKKKEEEKKVHIMVEDNAIFYPIEPAAPVYFQPQPQMYYAPAPAPAPAPASPKPANHAYWHGSSKADVDQQNIAIAQATGATKPTQLVPYKPSAEQQWWCRELDATWTLRTTREIQEELQPGFWQYASPGGYPYFIRRGG